MIEKQNLNQDYALGKTQYNGVDNRPDCVLQLHVETRPG